MKKHKNALRKCDAIASYLFRDEILKKLWLCSVKIVDS